ncbi:glycoside hydrolase family 3 N-terminal domain-containing protein [Streptosporangium sp. LJ11]|uniref:glycoside hydrolase family 3 protein n=1 Tax=Streptosporangium sp. LJ11 TaxID=3436927 RepID=UPI003F78FCFC
MTAAEPYRDSSRSVTERVEDLLARMTLREKAGLLFHDMATLDDTFPEPVATRVGERLMSHFNLVGGGSPREIAQWHNRVQQEALATRLAIPVTVSSDPRHSFSDTPGIAAAAGAFSRWPEPLGLAAIGDEALVERFADTVRREYLAVGIRLALHPQLDLATEPRWARVSGTFGTDATMVSRLARAYIRGLRGDALGPRSVSCMVKHFPGGGPQKNGEDPHFPHGREQVYPGGRFEYHLAPFEAALAAGATQVMPSYGVPVGTPYEEVAFAFNKGVITGLLRERYGFDGVVCTDWGVLTDGSFRGEPMPARAWGVEHLTPAGRARRALEAGVDQFGGERCPELVVELVGDGSVTERRVDGSVRRLLREKFTLGLFDRRFVDPDEAEEVVGRSEFRNAGLRAQSEAVTVLKNGALPLRAGARIYCEGLDGRTAAAYGEVVATPDDAEVALVRLAAPYEPRPGAFESFFHAGSLAFPDAVIGRLRDLAGRVPIVVDVHLERPAVLSEIAEAAAALLGSFGACDEALLDVVFGRRVPRGRLPVELPRSMEAVRHSRSDVPGDTQDPVFPLGHGLEFPDDTHWQAQDGTAASA